MASFAYLTVPPSATRLQGDPSSSSIQRVKKILTPLPTPTPEHSEALAGSPSTNGTFSPPSSSIPTSITSPTTAAFSLLPQMLLSSTLPPLAAGPKSEGKTATSIPNGPLLLTKREPLSLPATSANFKRFVERVGPIFWFQDRLEEVIMWRRGWRVTGVWMAAYAFLCYFPKMVFAVPHAALIGIMLASYPYPDPNSPLSTSNSTPPSESVNWQANLQAIQNLMGFISAAYDLIQPHTHLLHLSPSHLPSSLGGGAPSPALPLSPYPPYTLLALLFTFPPLLILLASPYFPTRLACLIAGLAPLVATHPHVRPLLLPLSQSIATDAMRVSQNVLTVLVRRYQEVRRVYMRFSRFSAKVGLSHTRGVGIVEEDRSDEVELPPLQTILERLRDDDRLDDVCWRAEMREVELWENERHVMSGIGRVGTPASRTSLDSTTSLPAYPDGPNTDLNNNNHTTGTLPDRHSRSASDAVVPTGPTTTTTTTIPSPRLSTLSLAHPSPPTMTSTLTQPAPVPHPADGGWSKANLRPAERRAWTRGRDGWGGIVSGGRRGSEGAASGSAPGSAERREGGEGGVEAVDGEGVVSNLTFSLAPGWSFVRTEGWRRDRMRAWAALDFDFPHSTNMDGWVYTNDTWGDARSAPYPGSVTRRRRWVRRVWYDGSHAQSQKAEGVGKGAR